MRPAGAKVAKISQTAKRRHNKRRQHKGRNGVIAYLSFQTIFFERFIACFRLHANVGFFIITIDFIGYLGTLGILVFKEAGAAHIDWPLFYNELSVWTGVACSIAFVCSAAYLVQARRPRRDSHGAGRAGQSLMGRLGMGGQAEYKYT